MDLNQRLEHFEDSLLQQVILSNKLAGLTADDSLKRATIELPVDLILVKLLGTLQLEPLLPCHHPENLHVFDSFLHQCVLSKLLNSLCNNPPLLHFNKIVN